MLQTITDIAELCARLGVRHFVLSPGSRSAPLTLAVARHPQLQTKVVPDERSAAFIALGMAQATGQTVGLICTSGTAAYNYAPAVAEAYYQKIPLLILTADRPPEWIDQQDGQTLRQQNLYGPHVKGSYQLPDTYQHPDLVWHLLRLVNEAVNLSQTGQKGPVHINVPLREPFYPKPDEPWQYSQNLKVVQRMEVEPRLPQAVWQQLAEEWQQFNQKLIIAGQGVYDEKLLTALEQTSKQQRIPVVADIISNLHGLKGRITRQDSFLTRDDAKEMLRPDLLITFGDSVISKNIKLYLRRHKPKQHWHMQAHGAVADTFQTLTRIIPVEPAYFFPELNNRGIRAEEQLPRQKEYYRGWKAQQERAEQVAGAFFEEQPWGEFLAVHKTLQLLPQNTQLHLANSMSVRYANLVGLAQEQKSVQVWANRGTSGIDGSNSTAVGSAVATGLPTLLITGDMAFLYDRNAFWHLFMPRNLRILVLNNHGGGIFRMIEGPRQQPELEYYFETKQPFDAHATAKEAGFSYTVCSSLQEYEQALPQFLDPEEGPKFLEVITDSSANEAIFKRYKQSLQKG